ncbi:MAG: hypothetical protein CL581_03285 [Alteromonadaceae bacterium]|nr:hypothetical protein [Alteromonadaceae bacterium]MBH86602.1 hypothetical protein [Alteromonadaceae bacterium]|tara:strand:- start:5486 stop:6022 length:537 start_codon:yes stop_codon:yes gene_type:complete
MTDNNDRKSFELGSNEVVPFFKSTTSQIKFEFWYLVILLVASSSLLVLIQLKGSCFGIEHENKVIFFAIIGGFLGGWVYDTKWFYRVTARGRDNQHAHPWHSHKFYWRVLTPFLAALVSFSTYLLASMDVFPIVINNSDSAKVSFAVCFLLGYFSDLVLSGLAKWAESFIPKGSKDGD